jgi:hypothetical protein
MRNHHQIPFLIFSADKGLDPSADEASNRALESELISRGIKFNKVKGSWQGVKEDSVLVGIGHKEAVIELGRKFNQDSILEVDGFRTARLYDLSDLSVVALGSWRQATRLEVPGGANEAEDYTYDPETDTYWVVDFYRPAS